MQSRTRSIIHVDQTSSRTTCFPFRLSTVTEALIKKFSPTATSQTASPRKKKNHVLRHRSQRAALALVHTAQSTDCALSALHRNLNSSGEKALRAKCEWVRDQIHRSFQMQKSRRVVRIICGGLLYIFLFYFCFIEFGLLKTLCYLVRSPAGLAILNFVRKCRYTVYHPSAMENKIVIIFIIFSAMGCSRYDLQNKKKIHFTLELSNDLV